MPDEWDLLLTLPNISPPTPTPFESAGYVICASNDERLNALADTAANATAKKMLASFKTADGTSYKPGCLLVRSAIPIAERSGDAIRSFRNVSALVSTTAPP